MKLLKTHKKIAAPVVALAVLAGCATATPYQPLGYPGERGGYTTQQLDQTHFRVSFTGNTLTSRQQVENYLLYRAAELTVQQGYACFTMVNSDTDRRTQVRLSPFGPYGYGRYGSAYYPGWTPSWRLHGPWGWHRYDPWHGDPFFPGRYDVDTVTSYQAMADIALSRAPCANDPGTFNAQQVMQNLEPYVIRPKVR